MANNVEHAALIQLIYRQRYAVAYFPGSKPPLDKVDIILLATVLQNIDFYQPDNPLESPKVKMLLDAVRDHNVGINDFNSFLEYTKDRALDAQTYHIDLLGCAITDRNVQSIHSILSGIPDSMYIPSIYTKELFSSIYPMMTPPHLRDVQSPAAPMTSMMGNPVVPPNSGMGQYVQQPTHPMASPGNLGSTGPIPQRGSLVGDRYSSNMVIPATHVADPSAETAFNATQPMSNHSGYGPQVADSDNIDFLRKSIEEMIHDTVGDSVDMEFISNVIKLDRLNKMLENASDLSRINFYRSLTASRGHNYTNTQSDTTYSVLDIIVRWTLNNYKGDNLTEVLSERDPRVIHILQQLGGCAEHLYGKYSSAILAIHSPYSHDVVAALTSVLLHATYNGTYSDQELLERQLIDLTVE